MLPLFQCFVTRRPVLVAKPYRHSHESEWNRHSSQDPHVVRYCQRQRTARRLIVHERGGEEVRDDTDGQVHHRDDRDGLDRRSVLGSLFGQSVHLLVLDHRLPCQARKRPAVLQIEETRYQLDDGSCVSVQVVSLFVEVFDLADRVVEVVRQFVVADCGGEDAVVAEVENVVLFFECGEDA